MKLKYEIVFQPIGDMYLAVPVGEKASKCPNYVRLNRSSYAIMQCLTSDTTEDAMVEYFMQEYDVDEAIARRDVRNIVEWLRRSDFLTE